MNTVNPARRAHWPEGAAAVVLVLLAAVVAHQTVRVVRQHDELRASIGEAGRLEAELRRLAVDQERASARLESARTAARGDSESRLPDADPAVVAAGEAWLQRVRQLRQLAAERAIGMDFAEIDVLSEREWLAAAKAPQLETEQQIRDTLRELRTTARKTLARLLQEAVSRHADANEGALPTTAEQLAPFTAGRVSAELLGRFEIAQRGNFVTIPYDEPLLIERATAGRDLDSRIVVTRRTHEVDDLATVPERELRRALRAFVEVNPGKLPEEPTQLLPYFRSPLQPAAVTDLLAKPRSDFSPDALRKLLPPD